MKKLLLAFSFLTVFMVQAQTLNFVNRADMPTARAASSGAYYFNYEYICNGFSGPSAYTSQIEKYDFANNSWSTFATSIPTIAKRYGNAEILSGILFLYNGNTANGNNDKLEIIELGTGNVTVSSTLNPNPVSRAGSALYGDYPLSFGGCVNEWTGNYSNKLYRLEPWSGGNWVQLADMPVALEPKGTVVYGNGTNPKLYVFGGYKELVPVAENFETVATTGNLSMTNWFNVTEAGTKFFQGKTFSSNKYAQISAYGGTVPEQEASNKTWLISPQVSLASSTNTFLTFDTLDGYNNGATLQAYIITNWTGDILTSTKTLLSAPISSGHTTGYGPYFINSGDISLSTFPSTFRIAFKYTGGYSPSVATTTYQIDNVRVYQKQISNSIYVYDFNSNAWSTSATTLPQSISAHSVVVDDAYSTLAKIYVTGDYDNQTFLGRYNVATSGFSTIYQTGMIGRRHHKAEIFGNNLYLFGGNTNPDTFSSMASTQRADYSTLANTEFDSQDLVTFYPNPTTDMLIFNSDIKEVTLYTFDGKKVNAQIQNNEVNVSHLPKGIYLIQGTNENGKRFSEKFIKK